MDFHVQGLKQISIIIFMKNLLRLRSLFSDYHELGFWGAHLQEEQGWIHTYLCHVSLLNKWKAKLTSQHQSLLSLQGGSQVTGVSCSYKGNRGCRVHWPLQEVQSVVFKGLNEVRKKMVTQEFTRWWDALKGTKPHLWLLEAWCRMSTNSLDFP